MSDMPDVIYASNGSEAEWFYEQEIHNSYYPYIRKSIADDLAEALRDISYCKTWTIEKNPRKLITIALEALSRYQALTEKGE